ncbi:hypothetical protein D3C79_49380 [compost metagenome]
MDKNARVDALGRSHEGKVVYRVVVDGVKEPMYMVDASCNTVDKEGKSLFRNPPVKAAECDSFIDPASTDQGPSDQWYKTAGALLEVERKEPPLQGKMSCGLNREWIDWYRNHGKGHSLRETQAEGMRRLKELRGK